MNDERLIDATLAGDKNAFGALARKYQDRVYNLALPIVGNADDALDVVQETFLQALAHLDSFRRSSRFYTWLYRIAYNCAVGALRKRGRLETIAGRGARREIETRGRRASVARSVGQVAGRVSGADRLTRNRRRELRANRRDFGDSDRNGAQSAASSAERLARSVGASTRRFLTRIAFFVA